MNSPTKEMKRPPCCPLPEEVVEEILLRLPAKSIVPFKRVCKAWRVLINDPLFANKQLQASMDSGKISLLVSFSYLKYPLQSEEGATNTPPREKEAMVVGNICSKSDGNSDELSCAFDEIDLPPFLKENLALPVSRYDIGRVPYHCNGIICVPAFQGSGPTSEVVLFNPTLNEFKFLPMLPHKFTVLAQGFGYDSRTDDYKFVRISARPGVVKAHLYSLRTDSWKEIKFDFKYKIFLLCKMGVYCGGVFYWRNITPARSDNIVLAFDMSDEEFHCIPLPDCFPVCIPSGQITWLAVWKESIVLFRSIAHSWRLALYEMWVMVDKFGGADGNTSWTKHLTIETLENIGVPLGILMDDELLLRSIDGGIASYNLYTKKVRTVRTDLMVFPTSYKVSSYTESLVSVKRGKMLNH